MTLQELLRPQDAGADARRAPPPRRPRRARRRARHRAAVAPNGSLVDLTGDAPAIVEQVETGRVYLDGSELIGALDGVVRDRIRMALRGKVAVSVIIDERGRPVGGAWVEAIGLPTTRRCATASRARSRPRSAGCSTRQARSSTTTTPSTS